MNGSSGSSRSAGLRSSRWTTESSPPTRRAGVQQITDTLTADQIDTVFRKWLRRLPLPFAAHRKAGLLSAVDPPGRVRAHASLDRPATGRCIFEEVIRENLDIGRPDQTQLIFAPASPVARPVAFAPILNRGRRALAPPRLKAVENQAVEQIRSGPSHRNDDQQHLRHLRLRHWSCAPQSARAAGDRLRRQQTLTARRISEPRLPDWRGPPRCCLSARRRRAPTGCRAALRRPPGARPHAHVMSLRTLADRLSPWRRAQRRGATARAPCRRLRAQPDDLRLAAAAHDTG